MKIAICDDEPLVADSLDDLLTHFSKTNQVKAEIDVYYSAGRLLKALAKTNYDAFFLDIEIGTESGIAIAQQIRQENNHVPIVFITSYREYMPEVFSLQTFDYLLKPVTSEQIDAVMNRVISYLDIQRKKLVFDYNKETFAIPLRDILYIEKEGRRALIHGTTTTFVTRKTTQELLELLDDSFMQIHHSFIVNSHYVQGITSKQIEIRNPVGDLIHLPLSRKFTKSVKAQLLNQLKG